jgi:DNA-binding NtrC family response regulator
LKNGTILLIDDALEFSQAMKRFLEKLGYAVVVTGDGRKAIDFLSTSAVDLVISEARMPGFGAVELMQEIRRRKIAAPVIFLTAYGEIESYMDLMNMGAFDYFNKPARQQEMLWTIKKAMKTQSISISQQTSSVSGKRSSQLTSSGCPSADTHYA